MSKVKRSWMAIVAATLLLGILVGVVWARPNDRPAVQEATRKIVLTGADFGPRNDDDDFDRGGTVYCNGGSCAFIAPVVFPTLGAVTVERIRLHVDDPNASGWADATLWRDNPASPSSAWLGYVASPLPESGGFQTYTSAAINKTVWPSHRAYVILYVVGSDITVYGVTVEYHRNL